MKMTWDPEVDILLITLDDVTKHRAKGDDLAYGGAYVDLAADGTILQIEIEKASEKYPKSQLETLTVSHPPMTLDEASKRSGLSVDALKKACQRGTLKGQRIGHNWTVTQTALNDYIVNRWSRTGGPAKAV